MSGVAITLTAYILSLSGNVQDNDQQRLALAETEVIIQHKESMIPFSHKNWKLINNSVCDNSDRNSPDYSNCTVNAKFIFQQICTALTNKASPYWHHKKYQTMYCDAAVNYTPLVATISYGEGTQISEQEKECNRLILKAMVSGTKEDRDKKNEVCKVIK